MGSPLPVIRIAIVDAETPELSRLGRHLTTLGCQVAILGSVADCLSVVARDRFYAVVTEERLPDGTGLQLLAKLKGLSPDIRVVFCTMYGSVAGAVNAIRSGAEWYFVKPVAPEEIANVILSAAGLSGGRRPLVPLLNEMSPLPSLPRVEWEHINQVLFACQGNLSKAARILGLHRRTLQRKVSRHAPR